MANPFKLFGPVGDCCCVSTSTTFLKFNLRGCNTFATEGSVSVTQGGTTLTGSSSGGVVIIGVPNNGSWSYTTTPASARLTGTSGSVTAVTGTTVSTNVNFGVASGYVCIPNCATPIPAADMTVTTPAGTYTMVYSASGGLGHPTWQAFPGTAYAVYGLDLDAGCSGVIAGTDGSGLIFNLAGTGSFTVGARASCGGDTPTMRSFSGLEIPSGSPVAIQVSATTFTCEPFLIIGNFLWADSRSGTGGPVDYLGGAVTFSE